MAKRSLLFAVRALNPAPRVDIAPPKRARGTRSVGLEERGIADAEEDREQDTRDKDPNVVRPCQDDQYSPFVGAS